MGIIEGVIIFIAIVVIYDLIKMILRYRLDCFELKHDRDIEIAKIEAQNRIDLEMLVKNEK